MKGEKLHDALNGVDERYVEESRPTAAARKRRFWIPAAAALLALVIGAFFVIRAVTGKTPERTAEADPTALVTPTACMTAAADPTAGPTVLPSAEPTAAPVQNAAPITLARAEFPETVGRDDYAVFLDGLLSSGVFYAGADLTAFYRRISAEFLLGESEGANAVCSPYSIYSALAMLAEISGGETRGQILDLIGAGSIDEVRGQYARLFEANYRNAEGFAQTVPAAAFFLRNDSPYNADAIASLKDIYRASAFSGTMGDPEYDALIRSWIDEATHGLLDEYSGDASQTDGAMVMKLVSSLYYNVGWKQGFGLKNGMDFLTPEGVKNVPAMYGNGGGYYVFDGYTVMNKELEDGSNMWFVLPDEGVKLSSVVADGDALAAVLEGPGNCSPSDSGKVFLTLPLFDVSQSFSLIDGLKRLGVTDCFDHLAADFSPLCDQEMEVTKADHAARVSVDENGVVGAAFTVFDFYNSPRMEIYLDRPFMFILTSADNTPLFMGTVYEP